MQFNMNGLTREQLVELIKNGDDSVHNQIRVKRDGTIFLSQIVGAEDISGLRFRFETFDAGNGYVGVDAAADDTYINGLYRGLKESWDKGRTGYIDDWLIR